jgi:hypothetical protein
VNVTTTRQHAAVAARLRQLALPLAAALLLAQAVVLALWPAAHLLMIDLQVYRAGGERLAAGAPLFDGGVLLDLPFVYPPFAPPYSFRSRCCRCRCSRSRGPSPVSPCWCSSYAAAPDSSACG